MTPPAPRSTTLTPQVSPQTPVTPPAAIAPSAPAPPAAPASSTRRSRTPVAASSDTTRGIRRCPPATPVTPAAAVVPPVACSFRGSRPDQLSLAALLLPPPACARRSCRSIPVLHRPVPPPLFREATEAQGASRHQQSAVKMTIAAVLVLAVIFVGICRLRTKSSRNKTNRAPQRTARPGRRQQCEGYSHYRGRRCHSCSRAGAHPSATKGQS